MENRDSCVCEVRSTDRLSDGLYVLTTSAPVDRLEHFVPGQFAQILLPGAEAHILRRPMSIAEFDRRHGTVSFLIREVGIGTAILGSLEPGAHLDVLMPLGKGYTPPKVGERVWLVGGGTGAGTVACARGFYSQSPMRAFFGFENIGEAYPRFEVKDTQYATRDGSLGYRGNVTELVEKALLEERPDRIIACGPRGMYDALSRIVGSIPTEVSLEERMGCGTGGCETCVASVNGQYLKVCTDGPIFNLREVDEFNG